jgi:hypothetical protein
MQMRLTCLRTDQKGAEIDSHSAGAANHHHQVPEQDLRIQAQAQRWAVGLLRRQESALSKLHLLVQEHRDPPFGPEPRKRREIRRGHQIQVPSLEGENHCCRDTFGQDQPDH